MNILSLFDGMSCGQQALERAGFKVNNYFASEIDKYAIQVTMANYPNTQQLGSVINVQGGGLPKIDILIGGSPCQSFSFAGKRKGMSTKDEQEILTLEHYLELKGEGFEFEGQSYLFWEYMRLLKETKPKYFLLENVMMGEKWEKILSKAIGVKPIMINSSLLSAQNRQRLYWTNIGLEPQGLFGDLESTIKLPNDKGILLKDVLESEVNEKYFLSNKFVEFLNVHKERHSDKGTGFGFKPKEEDEKANCLRANAALCPTDNMVEVIPMDFRFDEGFRPRKNGKSPTLCISNDSNSLSGKSLVLINKKLRRLTPIESERLQTVKDNYTNHVSDSQRYKMLGNGWTVDVIAHILKYIK
jgi:DNA (cytosine-5)-methyltransferase 3A